MTQNVTLVAKAIKELYGTNEDKIRRFASVYTLAKSIGELEKLPEQTQEYLEIESIVYNIDSSIYGESKSEFLKDMMVKLGIEYDIIDRVCYVAENFNDLEHITGLDHQILLEVHMLMKFKEKRYPINEIIKKTDELFITNYGKAFVKKAFRI
ncbi:MAG: hypothetical protein IKB73_05735 [Ruminococcus sp.]|nr:hypothetical protein [Ruminococcus sp.]